MSDTHCFPPIEAPSAKVLILGSIPSAASLAANEYYAHPRNQFWRIIADLLKNGPLVDYSSKIQALIDAGIVLWDVMKSCNRPGSLDAAIDKQSIVTNDFNCFFAGHQKIRQVFFNGMTAETSFRRLVLPELKCQPLNLHRLPSTSPTHAALNYQQKLEAWRVVVGRL